MNKFLFLIIIAVILTATGALAWDSYQNDKESRTLVRDIQSEWGTAADITYSVNSGTASYQPLIFDYDNDGDTEVVHAFNQFVEVLRGEDFQVLGEFDLSGAVQGHPARYDHQGERWYVVIVADTLRAFSFDGISVSEERTISSANTCSQWIGPKCFQDACYAVCKNSTTSAAYRFNMTDSLVSKGPDIAGSIKTNGALALSNGFISSVVPAIAYACDSNANSKWGICVLRGDTLNHSPTYFAAGNDDFADYSSSSDYINNPTFDNVDGLGSTEVVVGYSKKAVAPCTNPPTDSMPAVSTIKSDGTTLWTTQGNSVAVNSQLISCHSTIGQEERLTQQYIALINDTRYVCIGQSSNSGTPPFAFVGCLRASTGARALSRDVSGSSFYLGQNAPNGFSAAKDFTATEYLFFGTVLYNATPSGLVPQANFTGTIQNTDAVSYGDVNDDGAGDIIHSRSTLTQALVSLAVQGVDAVPQLFQNLSYSGYYGYYNGPVCKGTNISYRAQECPFGTGCNYNNDLPTNTERIRTDCGFGEQTIGAFAGTNPSVSCFYNQTGTFEVTLFLQDNTHLTDFSQFNAQKIVINVIEGTAGITCNRAGDFISTVNGQTFTGLNASTPQGIATGTDIQDSFTSLWDFIFGFSTVGKKARLFAAMAIIFFMVLGALKIAPNNNMAAWVAGILGTVVTWGIGLLETWILVILILTIVLVIIMQRTAFSTASGGGAG